MLPQRGHFGRLRFSVAKARRDTRVDKAWHADWTIIVDPPGDTPDAPAPHPMIFMLPAIYGGTATAA